ncbi:plasminogen-binding N-terminal domain-containing protein [Sulfurimonas sp.]|uniref:plasminogen-binding N-terminal domain-containing protein n=1 Tax=Sulfurimonas sp. TaxID=2022749 RepID=UPI002602F13F|nr:plasminogen-binding N-terminal domain-containing protein [Sulfurimonas sp.]
MKYIFTLLFISFKLMAAMVEAPIISVDNANETVEIKIDKIDVGVSGFVVHNITPEHSSILKNAVVKSFNEANKTAIIQTSDFHMLDNDSVPKGKWHVKVGDSVELAFGYSRSLLIAPSEEIYHQISKSINTQWIHPDLFATVLSFRGHPTPLVEDFQAMADATSTGLLFIFLDKKIYTVDMKSFHILSISDAPLEQRRVHLPFYTRVENIDANWFGKGSSRLTSYAPHYYALLLQNNKENKELQALYEKSKIGKENDR